MAWLIRQVDLLDAGGLIVALFLADSRYSDDHFLDGQIDLVVLVRHAVIFIGRCMILQKLLESLVDFTVYLIFVEGHNGAPLV